MCANASPGDRYQPRSLLNFGNLVECHPVVLNGLDPILLTKVNVADIDLQAAAVQKGLVLCYHLVGVQCLVQHVVRHVLQPTQVGRVYNRILPVAQDS